MEDNNYEYISILTNKWKKQQSDDYGSLIYESCTNFNIDHVPNAPIILNSIPKCGAHLLRNIFMHFINWDVVNHEWIHTGNDKSIKGSMEQGKRYFTGNLMQDIGTTRDVEGFKMVILIRNPRTYTLALARSLYHPSRHWWTDIATFVQENQIPFTEAITYAIVGQHYGNDTIIPINDMYLKFALQWFDNAAIIVKYEELMEHIIKIESSESYSYFYKLFESVGIPMFTDWKERVIAGSQPFLSASFIEGQVQENTELLTEAHELMLQLIAPGLKKMLGY